MAALVSHHPRPLLSRWDDLARTRRTVGLAAVDAHARIGMRDGPDPYRGRVLAKIPSYEASFRTFALHVELSAPFSGDAARDGAALLDAIRAGHVYTTLDALAAPGRVVGFEASTSSGVSARMGDFLAPDGGTIEWRAAAAAPEGSTLRLMCDGKIAAEAPATTVLTFRHHSSVGEDLSASQAGVLPAACRLEAGWNEGDRRVTWLITNPIYLRANDPALPPSSTAARTSANAAPRPPISAKPMRGRSNAIRSRRPRGAGFRRPHAPSSCGGRWNSRISCVRVNARASSRPLVTQQVAVDRDGHARQLPGERRQADETVGAGAAPAGKAWRGRALAAIDLRRLDAARHHGAVRRHAAGPARERPRIRRSTRSTPCSSSSTPSTRRQAPPAAC